MVQSELLAGVCVGWRISVGVDVNVGLLVGFDDCRSGEKKSNKDLQNK